MTRIQSFWRKYRWDIVVVLVVFAVAAIPRLLDLGTFLTADEKNWIGRSFEFVRAFKDFRFNDMLQTTHPGVTAMWTIGAAVSVKTTLGDVPFSFRNLEHFVTTAQFPIALLNTLAVPMIYILLRRVFVTGRKYVLGIMHFGFFVPVLAALFVALDPFVIGYSRVAHVDALLMSFLFLAVLATIVYARSGYKRSWLIMSAVLSGLALLTKAPAVFIIPFFLLVLLVGVKRNLFTRQVITDRFKDFLIWLLLIVIIFLVAWPAILWVPNPQGNVLVLKRDLLQATATSHDSNLGYTIEGGHYVATLVTRTTPLALVLTILGLLYLLLRTLWQRQGVRSKPQLATLWLLVAYVVFFIVMMTLGAKKGDRYIIPVFPALDVLAAVGLFVFVRWLMKYFELHIVNLGLWVRRAIPYFLLLIPVVYLAGVVASYHPYAVAYSNPLFPDNLSQELGWGEGLEQVGAWLSKQAPDAVVASWYPEELGAFTSAQVAHINAHEQSKVGYIVLYRNMFGRSPEHYANDFIDEYFKKRDPVYTAIVAGKEYAWVYEKPVYERHVGELLGGVRVGQEIDIAHEGFAGIELLMATFSGRASVGTLVVDLKDQRGGTILHRFEVPVSDLEDDRWLRLFTPADFADVTNVFIEVFAVDTTTKNAPTVRYTRDHSYVDTDIFLSTSGRITTGDQKPGNMGVRLLFEVDGEFVNQDQTKLLP